ncbi:alpha/beta hydrolase [Clostridium sp. C8-1-8]|uniref:alpha/beta hydrolase n=1 Tax=Clostridium sp. C8-1-8 TaxID=2698831 RepID=UPI00136B3BED|nr:alpha/beta hydrolase [Clostridium sp. C8-1-8]
MRKYDESEIKKLQEESCTIENKGLKVILKPSPKEDRPGYIDPVELGFIQAANQNNESSSNPEKIPSMEELIPIIRESMGFPNYNLNTVEIHTKYEELTGSGNTVGLWRYYTRKSQGNKKRPALVFFHGGGWIGGSTYTVENFCKLIAELADAVVFNVDYSLAPEKPYPNGLNDNYYAVKHIYDNAEAYGIDSDKICVGGDSAGGNYAAAVCLKSRDLGDTKLAMQVLIYPAVAIGDAKAPGYEWNEKLFDISEEQSQIIKNQCLVLGKPSKVEDDLMAGCYITNAEDIYTPYVSPIVAKSFEGLPKAIIAGAEFDGLRLQGEFYGKLLSEAGVDTTCYRYKGMTHAFIDKLGHVPQAEDLCIEIAEAMKSL